MFNLTCSVCSRKEKEPFAHGDACPDCGYPLEEARIRLKRTVRGDLIFAGTVAHAGEHQARMNQHGAVSVVATNGKLLGIMPDEMEWISGMPDGWCGLKKQAWGYEI